MKIWAERPETLQKTKIHENLIESLSIRSGSSFTYQIPLNSPQQYKESISIFTIICLENIFKI